MDDFFSYISKAVIVIPIIIVISALLFLSNPKTKTSPAINPYPSTFPAAQITQGSSLKFDLIGPITCDNLFIENKKVFYSKDLNNYLLSGDCLYQWQTNKFGGVRRCGLTGYVDMAENYAGMFNVADLANNNTIAGLTKNQGINVFDVLKSCKKRPIKDESVFKIPIKILFKTQ